MTLHNQDAESVARAALDSWQSGQHANAIEGLQRAIKGNDSAAMGLALTLSGMPEAPKDIRKTVRDSLEAAESGPVRNRHLAYMRAAGLGGDADIRGALTLRGADAQTGDLQALTELALLALWADQRDAAMAALDHAAAGDSAHAIAALLRIAVSDGKVLPHARSRAAGLGKSGHPLGPYLEAATRDLPLAKPVQNAGTVFDASMIDTLVEWATGPLPASKVLNGTPSVASVTAFSPPAVCDYLVANSIGHMRPAGVLDPKTGVAGPDPYRKALVATLPDGVIDLIGWAIKDRMARLAGSDYARGEPLSVLGYRPGDEYKPHYDFMTASEGLVAQDLAQRGQRVATCLVRLSDDFEGGATVFPKLDLSWAGKAGDALVFANVDKDGKGEKDALHAGEPVHSGLKLMASLWLRERA